MEPAAMNKIPVHQLSDNAASVETLQTRALLKGSLEIVPPKVKTFEEIRAAMLALQHDCTDFHNAHAGSNFASDAVSGLCDLLSDHDAEFEAEIPTSSPPAEYRRAGGHGEA
jgi:hypothetical protein